MRKFYKGTIITMNNDKQNSSSESADQSKPSFVKRVGDPSQASNDQRKTPPSPASFDTQKESSSDMIKPRRIPNDADRAARARAVRNGASSSPATRREQIPSNYRGPRGAYTPNPRQSPRGQRPQQGFYPAPRQADPRYRARGPYRAGQAPPPPQNPRSQANKGKGKKKRKPVLILLDLLIVALIVGGLYFIIKPKYDLHARQED